MKTSLALLALAAVGCSSSGTWRRVETPNFVVRTDLGSSDAKRAAVALEVTRDALVSAVWPTFTFSGEKTQVYVLANGVDFERYFGRITAGYFDHTSPAQFFLYGSAGRWELRRSAHFPTQSVLRHEMTHLLSSQVWPRQPRWLAEGLANFLEPVYYSEDEKSLVVGDVNLQALREYKAVRTFGVGDALAWQGNAIDGMAEREAAGLYGISWLLFHWFFNRHNDELVRYIEAIQSGTPPDEAFRVALPNLDLGSVDKELYQYQSHGEFVELWRPLVATTISESTLQDQPLDSLQLGQVKQVLAEASKRSKVQSHGGRSESAGAEGEARNEAAKPPPRIDYSKLPALPQYPCGGSSKESAPGQPTTEIANSPSGDTRRTESRTGGLPSRKGGQEPKHAEKRGRLAAEVIQRVVRASYRNFRRCYEDGLKKNANLGGSVSVRFVIETDGSVRDVKPFCVSLPDPAAVSCIVQHYGELKFPEPSGIVTVVYPLMFSPSE